LALGRLYNAAEFLDVQSYHHLQRWAKAIDQRPAVQRGVMVNRNWGEPHEQLPERHSSADFAKVSAKL
jgi:GST-like protein